MISAGEIGSTFIIVDEATEVLTRIAAGMERLVGVTRETQLALDKIHMPTAFLAEIGKVDDAFKGLMDVTGKLDGSFVTLGETAGTSTGKLVTGFGEVDGAINTSITRVGELKAELASLKMPTLGAPVVGGGGGGGFGGGGGGFRGGGGGEVEGGGANLRNRRGSHDGPFHISGQKQKLGMDGGPHIGVGGTAGAIAGFMLDGIYEESQIDDVVTEALITGQQQVDDSVTKEGLGKTIRDQIRAGSARSGFDYHAEGEAILQGERLLGALPVNERLALMNEIMPFAETEARLKHEPLAPTAESFIELSHQAGIYDPAGVKEMARNFAYTSLITPASPSQFVNTLSYSMPLLHSTLDMPPEAAMFLTANAQAAGVKSTKSGTWLRSFYQQSEPSVGLNGAPLSKTQQKHNSALQSLGELDENNQPTWHVTGADGKMDWMASIVKQAQILQEHLSKLPPPERVAAIQAAYGERGGGIAALENNKKFVENLPIIAQRMKDYKGGDDSLDQYKKGSPIQQARTTVADFNNAMSDLGQAVMPVATPLIRAFDAAVKYRLSDTVASIDNFPETLLAEGRAAGKPETFAEKAHKLQHRPIVMPEKSIVGSDPVLGNGFTPQPANPTPQSQPAIRLPARPFTPVPNWIDRHNPFNNPGGVTGGSAPMASGPIKVSMAEPMKLAGITPVSGNVNAQVAGTVAISNLGELGSMISGAIGSAVSGAIGQSGGASPNRSAYHDDHSHFALPDASVG